MEFRHPPLSDDELRRRFDEVGFVTSSHLLVPVLRQAYRAACASDITVLLEGETGTGKQVLASAIHRFDQKRGAFAFVTMHCGSLSETLVESELFGHQKGAFTGAVANRKGLFQAADRGTLFLDDVNDLPLHLQGKLLDVLQRGRVRSMGSDEERRIDVRVLAASNQPLKPLVVKNLFRADLFHRLNVVRLWLPPLRQRMQELSSLLVALAHRHRHVYGPIKTVDEELLALLHAQPFPGNVRELENDVQRMLFSKTAGTSLGVADWHGRTIGAEAEEPPDFLGEAADKVWKAVSLQHLSYAQAIKQIERSVLKAALEVKGRTRRQIAESLQTSERTLYHKIRTYRLG